MRTAATTPEPAHPALVETFRGRAVLITGAAGSIGSELTRQVAALPIARILLLDRDENSMFELLRSFEQGSKAAINAVLTPVIGDLRDGELVRHIFAQWRPEILLHAAAYKHVPMMEANPCEAVLNNITGTRILADAAIEWECDRFLLISSDKAVEPASVMGATKRVAELLIQERGAQPNAASPTYLPTNGRDIAIYAKRPPVMASVRFVNVIGSRGSVVPIFEQQIAAGGPVTITDPEMTRYFMTVREAARLLLEAATLDQPGAIYALEAGKPVRIADLAHDMIHQAGFVAGCDIAIEITGMRPGEKLRERLFGENESPVPTVFPGIDRVDTSYHPPLDLDLLDRLESAAQNRDSARVIELLQELPTGYTPAGKQNLVAAI